jgi:hypothetical protein
LHNHTAKERRVKNLLRWIVEKCPPKRICGRKEKGNCESFKSKPTAAIRDPPTEKADGNRGSHSPPKGENQVGDEPKNRKAGPKYFLLHRFILELLRDAARKSRVRGA